MKYSGERNNLRVQIDTHQGELSAGEVAKLLDGLDSLERQTANFPIADLRILVEDNHRSSDYSIKLTLILPGTTLVGNDHDTMLHAAFERCLNGLLDNVQAYKDRLGQVEERQKQEKRTHQDLEPTVAPDPLKLDEAVRAGDYAAFRAATLGYDEPVRLRVGRWVQRSPEMEAVLHNGLQVSDVVEEVFLLAFDRYDQRPKEIRLGDWLDSLIDPAVKQLLRHRDEEMENINMARSARAAELGPEAV